MISDKIKNSFVLVVSYLYVLLFVYAAVSKLLDYENFQVQLGQSPLLSAYASIISWLVPAIELFIVVLILLPTTRLFGLFGSFILMVMFTVYIYLILTYSSFVPCSCGGVLEKMTWNQHLLFNIAFIIQVVLAILLHPDVTQLKFTR
ncbi:MAG: hypothetical protein Q8K02_10890 [Flavobacterium sp.]|nr:hypothetical protein [Flavobacterium sp.]